MGRYQPEGSWEERYAGIVELVERQTGRSVSRNTLVGYRTRSPGPRFRVSRFVEVLGAVGDALGEDPYRTRLEARWFAACARIRDELDVFLGETVGGDRWVDDLAAAVGDLSARTWAALGDSDYPVRELDELMSREEGRRLLELAWPFLGIEQEDLGAALDDLRARLPEDETAREDVRRRFALMSALSFTPPYLGACVTPGQLPNMRLHEHVALWTSPRPLLRTWHQLIAAAYSEEAEELLGPEAPVLVDLLLVMTRDVAERVDPGRQLWARLVFQLAQSGKLDGREAEQGFSQLLMGAFWDAGTTSSALERIGLRPELGGETWVQGIAIGEAARAGRWREVFDRVLTRWEEAPEEEAHYEQMAWAAAMSALCFARILIAVELEIVSDEDGLSGDLVRGVHSSFETLDLLLDHVEWSREVLYWWGWAFLRVAEVWPPSRVEWSEESHDRLALAVELVTAEVEDWPDDGRRRGLLARLLELGGARPEALAEAKEAARLGHPEAWRRLRRSK